MKSYTSFLTFCNYPCFLTFYCDPYSFFKVFDFLIIACFFTFYVWSIAKAIRLQLLFTFVGYSQASFHFSDSSPSLSRNLRGFVLHCQHDSFPDPSCNFRDFMHDFSQGPSNNSQGSMQHYHRDSSPRLSWDQR